MHSCVQNAGTSLSMIHQDSRHIVPTNSAPLALFRASTEPSQNEMVWVVLLKMGTEVYVASFGAGVWRTGTLPFRRSRRVHQYLRISEFDVMGECS